MVANTWLVYNSTKKRSGEVLNLTAPEIVYKHNMTDAKWLWMDIFSWPFPAPTPRLKDFGDRVHMENVVEASELFVEVIPEVILPNDT